MSGRSARRVDGLSATHLRVSSRPQGSRRASFLASPFLAYDRVPRRLERTEAAGPCASPEVTRLDLATERQPGGYSEQCFRRQACAVLQHDIVIRRRREPMVCRASLESHRCFRMCSPTTRLNSVSVNQPPDASSASASMSCTIISSFGRPIRATYRARRCSMFRPPWPPRQSMRSGASRHPTTPLSRLPVLYKRPPDYSIGQRSWIDSGTVKLTGIHSFSTRNQFESTRQISDLGGTSISGTSRKSVNLTVPRISPDLDGASLSADVHSVLPGHTSWYSVKDRVCWKGSRIGTSQIDPCGRGREGGPTGPLPYSVSTRRGALKLGVIIRCQLTNYPLERLSGRARLTRQRWTREDRRSQPRLLRFRYQRLLDRLARHEPRVRRAPLTAASLRVANRYQRRFASWAATSNSVSIFPPASPASSSSSANAFVSTRATTSRRWNAAKRPSGISCV